MNEEREIMNLVKNLTVLDNKRKDLENRISSYPPYMNVTREILQKELEEVQLKICNYEYEEILRELILKGEKLE